jgi:hypothetical protein
VVIWRTEKTKKNDQDGGPASGAPNRKGHDESSLFLLHSAELAVGDALLSISSREQHALAFAERPPRLPVQRHTMQPSWVVACLFAVLALHRHLIPKEPIGGQVDVQSRNWKLGLGRGPNLR